MHCLMQFTEGEEDIENLMNDPDTKFIDQSVIKHRYVDSDLSLIKKPRNRKSYYSNFDTI